LFMALPVVGRPTFGSDTPDSPPILSGREAPPPGGLRGPARRGQEYGRFVEPLSNAHPGSDTTGDSPRPRGDSAMEPWPLLSVRTNTPRDVLATDERTQRFHFGAPVAGGVYGEESKGGGSAWESNPPTDFVAGTLDLKSRRSTRNLSTPLHPRAT